MSEPRPPRDQRVDLLRGLAQAVVFIDHCEMTTGTEYVSRWTLKNWGPSDAAEQFILLSGLVVGRTTSSRLEREGLGATFRHALRRTAVLYLGYVIAAAAVRGLSRVLPMPHVIMFDAPGLEDGPWLWDVWRYATLQGAPHIVQILVMYLVLLPLSPLIVAWLRRSIWQPLSVSLLLYVAMQSLLGFPAGRQWLEDVDWYFQVCGWQFLYVVGLAAGVVWQRWAKAPTHERSSPRSWPRWPLTCLAAGIVLAGYGLRPEATSSSTSWLHSLPDNWGSSIVLLVNKRTLGPLRILHALAVAWLLASMLPRSWTLSIPGGLNPLAAAGRRSLLTYTLGTVLTVLAAWGVGLLGTDWLSVLIVEVNGLALLGIAAVYRFPRWRGGQARCIDRVPSRRV